MIVACVSSGAGFIPYRQMLHNCNVSTENFEVATALRIRRAVDGMRIKYGVRLCCRRSSTRPLSQTQTCWRCLIACIYCRPASCHFGVPKSSTIKSCRSCRHLRMLDCIYHKRAWHPVQVSMQISKSSSRSSPMAQALTASCSVCSERCQFVSEVLF